MDRPLAVYRCMLRMYPAKFRREYGEAMTQLFADLLADQRQSVQPLGTFRLWVQTVVDTLSSASRERMEETMHSNVALTRALLIAVPIAVFAAMGLAGLYAGLSVLVAGIIVLVVRRRSLPDVLIGPRRGPLWVWPLVGVVMVVSSGITPMLARDEGGELAWMLWSLFFFGGTLIVGASIVRALALAFARHSGISRPQ
ncbi:MAG: hypothetical protein HY532_06485 [Chloroflexi bacterium]|nr:hypothetical protein [Chloroflexota bacterium]